MGWHLPNQTEWYDLFIAVGAQSIAGKVLKSQTGWKNNGNGTDALGFSALPVGYRRNDGGHFYFDGREAIFWSATVGNLYGAYGVDLNYDSVRAHLTDRYMYLGFSVRCVKD